MSRILAAAAVSAVSTIGVWLLLSIVARAVYGLVGSPSAIAQLFQFGMPVLAILAAPLVAGLVGGLVTGTMSSVIGSIAAYVVVGYVLCVVSSQVGLVVLGATLGLPLIVMGHLAGVASRPRRVPSV